MEDDDDDEDSKHQYSYQYDSGDIEDENDNNLNTFVGGIGGTMSSSSPRPKFDSNNGIQYLETDDQLFQFLDSEVKEVADYIGGSYSLSLAILRKYEWNKDAANAAYIPLDSHEDDLEVNQEELCKSCSVSRQACVLKKISTPLIEGGELLHDLLDQRNVR